MREGSNTFSVLVSNENHTFSVDKAAGIDDGQQAAGTSDVTVYEGLTKLDVSAAGSLTRGSWYLTATTENMDIVSPVFDYTNDKISINQA